MAEREIERKLDEKVKQDTQRELPGFEETRSIERARIMEQKRKISSRVVSASSNRKKEIYMGEADKESSFVSFDYGGNANIVFVLGLTLCLINDFFDLVLWQNSLLVNQAIDITNLFLLLLLMNFFSKSYFITTFLLITVFILEIIPVLGVLPFWTIGMGLWYLANRKN